ncbi:unnamed protein product [Caenorhabditis auriculariae]|uniref:Uncharacterized protein n=1 Tax=Caenorhabditis auriculariae TaxID=2777116 RepID=A0A8S1HPK4_9PELO|nr:unnamed protein product [Caenorhabditis auriculariae]
MPGGVMQIFEAVGGSRRPGATSLNSAASASASVSTRLVLFAPFIIRRSTTCNTTVEHGLNYILSSSKRNWTIYAQKNEAKDRKTMLST